MTAILDVVSGTDFERDLKQIVDGNWFIVLGKQGGEEVVSGCLVSAPVAVKYAGGKEVDGIQFGLVVNDFLRRRQVEGVAFDAPALLDDNAMSLRMPVDVADAVGIQIRDSSALIKNQISDSEVVLSPNQNLVLEFLAYKFERGECSKGRFITFNNLSAFVANAAIGLLDALSGVSDWTSKPGDVVVARNKNTSSITLSKAEGELLRQIQPTGLIDRCRFVPRLGQYAL